MNIDNTVVRCDRGLTHCCPINSGNWREGMTVGTASCRDWSATAGYRGKMPLLRKLPDSNQLISCPPLPGWLRTTWVIND